MVYLSKILIIFFEYFLGSNITENDSFIQKNKDNLIYIKNNSNNYSLPFNSTRVNSTITNLKNTCDISDFSNLELIEKVK